MPEGPEIRRAADALAEAVVGHPLRAVEFAPPALQRYQSQLVGQTVASVSPRGKALLTHFDSGLTLYTHNQLYGVWKISRPGDVPDTRRSLRVALHTAHASIRLYSASTIEIWPTAGLDRHPFLQRLGPDVLDPTLTADAVHARLQDPRFSGRALPGLLLDQSFLAGMGNYLRAEALFEAGIAPHQRPRDLPIEAGTRLASALLSVPQRSYRCRGIQRATGMRADYISASSDGFRFEVFDRDGKRCRRCGGTIVRGEAAGRRLYWCPGCQT